MFCGCICFLGYSRAYVGFSNTISAMNAYLLERPSSFKLLDGAMPFPGRKRNPSAAPLEP